MLDFPEKKRYDWPDFLLMMRLLRSAEGCPWDRVQTHTSIRRNFLEETWEAIDAIDRDHAADMCEELGDVLMQVAFHAQIEAERGRFDMSDVVDGVTRKLLYRHPHVFETAAAENGEQALANWDARKRQEKGHTSVSDAIEAVPHTLPALWRAEKIGKKAANAGFEWENVFHALAKLEEEVRELRQALERSYGETSADNAATNGETSVDTPATNGETSADTPATNGETSGKTASPPDINAPHGVRDEIGDTLFITAGIARMCALDPEDALHQACDKFNRRFRAVETAADKPLSDYSEAGLVALWQDVKTRTEEEHPSPALDAENHGS